MSEELYDGLLLAITSFISGVVFGLTIVAVVSNLLAGGKGEENSHEHD